MDISTEIAAIEAASKGEDLRQPLIDALDALNSGSLPAVTSSDAGKILKVNSNGEWVAGEKSGYMPVPSASLNIIENGTVDVTNYASAIVNVSGGGGGGSTLISKNITTNGTYDAQDDNADGYSSVIVNVQSGHIFNDISIISSEDVLYEKAITSGIGAFFSSGNNSINYFNNDSSSAIIDDGDYLRMKTNGFLSYDLGQENKSCTIYTISKSYSSKSFSVIIGAVNQLSRQKAPGLYNNGNNIYCSVFQIDYNTGISAALWHVMTVRINTTTNYVDYFIDGVKINTSQQITNSGRYSTINSSYPITSDASRYSDAAYAYFAVVDGVETDADIIANQNALMTHYSDLFPAA